VHSIFLNPARIRLVRALILPGLCVCVALAASSVVRAQDAAVATQAPVQAGTQDATAFDPFAASETLKASRPSPATSAAAPAAAATLDASAPRLATSLDLLYQGSYIPELISIGGVDRTEQDVFIDAAAGFSLSQDATLGARVVANHERRKAGTASSRRNDATALEYYYRQRFAGGAQALTVGRRLVGWSSGFLWRPANLIDNGFSTKNIEIQDPYRYRGVDQVRYELIASRFDAVVIASNHDKKFFGGEQFAAKIGIKGAVDVSLMYAVNGSYSRKYGTIIDASLPWGTTFALEAVHVDVSESRLDDPAHFGKTIESLSGIGHYEDVYLSLTKFIDDKRRLSAEYFHNGRGMADASFRNLPAAARAAATAAVAAGRMQPVIDPAIFSQQYLGRNYAYLSYTGYVDAWKLQFRTSVLMNTGDDSSMRSISVKRELGSGSELTLNINTFHGSAGSDFGSVTNGVSAGVSYVVHLL